MSCVFCGPNWDNLDILAQPMDNLAVIRPLDPVTEGHVLVIAMEHSDDAASCPRIAADLMYAAAEWIAHSGIQANIITSVGPLATQTVMHTHVHVVPRRQDDGLPLPWTPQHEVKSLEAAVHMKTILQESGGDYGSMGIFQQQDRVGWADARTKQ